jgi:hypothetical protein
MQENYTGFRNMEMILPIGSKTVVGANHTTISANKVDHCSPANPTIKISNNTNNVIEQGYSNLSNSNFAFNLNNTATQKQQIMKISNNANANVMNATSQNINSSKSAFSRWMGMVAIICASMLFSIKSSTTSKVLESSNDK